MNTRFCHTCISDLAQPTRFFFTLVRSATPPGEAVQRISTRRPYDDPNVDRVYYRLIPEQGSTVDKTHMPFALNDERLQKVEHLVCRCELSGSSFA
ncbi:fatty acid cis/trans isomerase [Vibrio lentus]|nr:fatty acid cis/trans isomerase [Vibrio lentus]